MKVALQVLAYDVNRFINPMLQNAAPWVDKIFIAYPDRPWDYNPLARDSRVNPTKLESICLEGLPCATEIVRGDWPKDEDTREELLSKARSEGFDWMVIQDADEFYTDDGWAKLLNMMSNTPRHGLRTSWYTFWKSSRFVLTHRNGAIKDQNQGAAIRCNSEIKFVRSRTTNLISTFPVCDAPCYHYGYVRSDEEMLEKVTTWGHSAEFDGPMWHRLKWRQWDPDKVNLHPTRFNEWYRALPFPNHQPPFAEQFDLEIPAPPQREIRDAWNELVWDQRSKARQFYRNNRVLLSRKQ